MKKILIGLGVIGTIAAAPVIAFTTTKKDNELKASLSTNNYKLYARLRESAQYLTHVIHTHDNFSFAANHFVDLLGNEKYFDKTEKSEDKWKNRFTSTTGMYSSIQKQIAGRHLIDLNHTYNYGDETRVVFYYDRGNSSTTNTPTNESIDLFPDQPQIKKTLEENYWGDDILVDSSQIDAVVIYTLDKSNNVTNVASGIRRPETRNEFQYVEEMLMFKKHLTTPKTPDVDLSKYMWVPKYGIACDLSVKTPFRYLFDVNQQLVHGVPLATTNIDGFQTIINHPGLLSWSKTEEPIPLYEMDRNEDGEIIVPLLDRTTLQVPIIQPELNGDSSVIPLRPSQIPLPDMQAAPSLISDLEKNKK